MKKSILYYCEKCNASFDSEIDCTEHEENCGVKIKFICDKCGKLIEYSKNINDEFFDFSINECWSFNSGRAGYGSKFDGCDISFNLCDDCLMDFVNSFTIEGQEKIHNSGSNQYLDPEEWIKINTGMMPDEEMEQLGFISPRQTAAYLEKFPQCDKVKINIYEDGSKGSSCYKGAFGDDEAKCGHNKSTECYNCSVYEIRKGEIKTIYKK